MVIFVADDVAVPFQLVHHLELGSKILGYIAEIAVNLGVGHALVFQRVVFSAVFWDVYHL